jgi:DNA polymerase-3 subunit alpha
VFESVDTLIAFSAGSAEAAGSTQVSLFGGAGEGLPPPRLPAPEDWAPMERLTEEFAAVGFYLSGHPLDDYAPALRRKRVERYADIVARGRTGVATRIAGTVMARQERKSARGARFAFVRLSDPTGVYEVTVFSEILLAHRDDLEPGRNVVLSVTPEIDGDQVKFLTQGVQPLDKAVEGDAAAGLRVHVREAKAFQSIRARLEEAKAARGGPVSLVMILPEDGREVEVAAPGAYRVPPAIRSAIKAIPGVLHVEEF